MDPDRFQNALQKRYNQFLSQKVLNLQFPAKVHAKRTKAELIQHRLLECGVPFGDIQTLPELKEGLDKTISNLQETGCFESVRMSLEPATDAKEDEDLQQLVVHLNERNWYHLYVGGGFKYDGLTETSSVSVPMPQFEASGGLRNLTGYLDKTLLQYTRDPTSNIASWRLHHERPFFSILPEPWQNWFLMKEDSSQYSVSLQASMDTVDHEWTRSCREQQRVLSARIANQSVAIPERSHQPYLGLQWNLSFRDILPRRHTSIPYAYDASPEIVAQSGPSMKHSLQLELRSNGAACDNKYNPARGLDVHTKLEVAGPPGDVGFAKVQGGTTLHLPLWPEEGISFHASVQGGFLQPLSFGGVCNTQLSSLLSDRFFVGGPLQLRGFSAAGIGPRAKTGGKSTPGGDALGGNLFYTNLLAISAPFPLSPQLRMFGFANGGTVANTTARDDITLLSILASTRTSVGVGISGTVNDIGRLEATFAWPIRYGPRDARRNAQFGFGFSFG